MRCLLLFYLISLFSMAKISCVTMNDVFKATMVPLLAATVVSKIV